MYNLRNLEGQKKFKKYTSNTRRLSSIFDSHDDINILSQRFIRKLDGCISMSFKKIRVSSDKESYLDSLYNKLRLIKTKEDKDSEEDRGKKLQEIAGEAEERYKKIKEKLHEMKTDGGEKKFTEVLKFKENTAQ